MGAVTVYLVFNGAILYSTLAAEEGSAQEMGAHLQSVQWLWLVLGIVCTAVTVVYFLLSCTDCYNSEVSTDCHPAATSGGPKWGGAGGYTSAVTSDVNNSVLTAGFTGEAVVPDDYTNNPLPYALIPSQVPEAQGFRGYESIEMTRVPTMSGYGSTGVHQLAGYAVSGDGQGGYGSPAVPQPVTGAYGGSGVGQSGFGGSGLYQLSQPTYGLLGGGQQAAAAGGGGVAGQRAGRNVGEESSDPSPGARVPLMSEEPPPPYDAPSHRH